MTNTQKALKPCPFCGRDDDLLAVETRAGGEGWWRVFCDHCCTDGPSDQVREKAIAAWNHRLESLEAEVERLKEGLEKGFHALKGFAAIQADDGDDFSSLPDQVFVRCETTAGEIKRAREAMCDLRSLLGEGQ